MHDTDTFGELFFFLLTVELLFTNLCSHRHEEHTHLVGGTEGPLFRCVGSRLGVVTHSLLEDFHQALDDLGLFLFLALQDNRSHLVVFVFTHVVSSFSRDSSVCILDLQTVLVVGFKRLLIGVNRVFDILDIAVGTSDTDVSGNQLFLVFLIHSDEVVVFLDGKIPLLGVGVSHRDREGSVNSVGALRIVADEVLGAADSFVRHLGFVVAQAGAIEEGRSFFVLRVTLVSKFEGQSGLLLVRNGVVGLSGKANCREGHGILREVVRDEQERLGCNHRLLVLLVVASSTQDTLDGERRALVVLREEHEGFSSLAELVHAFVSGSGFEHGLISNVDSRVTLDEV